MSKIILAFGETLWDLLPGRRILGGAPFNFAYRACCLGDRGRIVTRLGRDELGRQVWQQIVQLGMETTFVQWDDRFPTGTVQVSFDPANRPDYFIVPDVAYDHVEAGEELLRAAERADCVCFGTLSQRAPASRRALAALLEASGNCVKLLDVNLRKNCFSAQTVGQSLARTDILRCNEEETLALSGLLGLQSTRIPEFCREAIDRWTLSHCLVTLGSRGAYAASSAGEHAYAAGYRVNVVDSLGAGDAFTAGFVHCLLRGRDLAGCLELGNALGAMVAAQEGATQPISEACLHQFVAAGHDRIYDDSLREFLTL